MLRIISIVVFVVVFLLVLVVGVQFSSANSDPVTVRYFLGEQSLPLALIVVSAFAVGAVVTFLVGLGIVLPLRWRLIRLRREVSIKDHELASLRQQTGTGVRHT
ncbi:MAG: LapA family protein [Pseudomonadota bacterium]|nr:LapA family protein [Pseudomonadota bacterium]